MHRQRFYERIRSLKERDPEKYKYLYRTPILKMIHAHAYEATATPNGMLMTKAAKLRLNMPDVTPANPARELKNIGSYTVSTIWPYFGEASVSRAASL